LASENIRKAINLIIILVSALAATIITIPLGAILSSTIISPDGSITGSNIALGGYTYTLVANLSGDIQVEKSGIVINGDGYTLNKGSIDLGNCTHVIVENLYIIDGNINGGDNNTFYDDFINNSPGGACIFLSGSNFNKISYCTLDGSKSDQGAIYMLYGSTGNTITENNVIGGISEYLASSNSVDKNYFSDYLTRYPSATEADNSGIGNTPYVYFKAQTNPEVSFQDNHPLMNAVTIPLTNSSTTIPIQSPSPTPTLAPTNSIPEFPTAIVVGLIVIAGTAVTVAPKKHLNNRSMT